MNWISVTDGTKGSPKMTLRKNGQIGFNGSFVKHYQVSESKYAEVAISDDKKKLGIRFFKEEKDNTTEINNKRKNNVYVTAKQLGNIHGISASTHQLGETVTHDDEEGFYIVDIIELKK